MTMMATLLYVPHMTARVRDNPWLFTIALANMLAIANIPREFHHGRDWRAFLSSCAAIITLMALSRSTFFRTWFTACPIRKTADNYQRRVLAENARIMARHCVHRGAGGDCLHCLHLLDLPCKVKLDRMSY